MRTIAIVIMLGSLTACGGGSPAHYNEKTALECLQRTNSTRGGGGPNSIFLLFASDDGMSAVEPVFVSFGSATAAVAVPAGLGVFKRRAVWTERRGDAGVSGYGPYEPPIARRQHIPDKVAKAAVRKLGTDVRRAIDGCLEKNRR